MKTRKKMLAKQEFTLQYVYRTYKDKCEKTRNGTLKRKLAFFDEVGEFPPINKSFADWMARQDFFTILEKIYLRKTRRRKVGEKEARTDQEFLFKLALLAQVLFKEYLFSTISFVLIPATVSGFIYVLSWKMFYET